MRKFMMAAAVAAFVVLQASSVRAEDVENPEYGYWKGFKAGSFVTLKMENDAGGFKSEMEYTHTLVEITAEKAVIESKGSMVTGGNKIDMPANKREIPAKVKKAEGGKSDAKADTKESEETIEVGGKKVKCKVIEAHSEASGTKSHSKTWMSNDIPGHIAKLESKSEGAAKSSLVMTATKWESK